MQCLLYVFLQRSASERELMRWEELHTPGWALRRGQIILDQTVGFFFFFSLSLLPFMKYSAAFKAKQE